MKVFMVKPSESSSESVFNKEKFLDVGFLKNFCRDKCVTSSTRMKLLGVYLKDINNFFDYKKTEQLLPAKLVG